MGSWTQSEAGKLNAEPSSHFRLSCVPLATICSCASVQPKSSVRGALGAYMLKKAVARIITTHLQAVAPHRAEKLLIHFLAQPPHHLSHARDAGRVSRSQWARAVSSGRKPRRHLLNVPKVNHIAVGAHLAVEPHLRVGTAEE